MRNYKTHVFICTNGSPEQIGKCNSKGAERLHSEVKAACRTIGPEVRVNKSGCLGQCELGIACVIYPNSKWHLELTTESTQDLVEIIERVHTENSKIL
jgi:(2Fe-2S) ferredoxin